jgi:hypothetical protein
MDTAWSMSQSALDSASARTMSPSWGISCRNLSIAAASFCCCMRSMCFWTCRHDSTQCAARGHCYCQAGGAWQSVLADRLSKVNAEARQHTVQGTDGVTKLKSSNLYSSRAHQAFSPVICFSGLAPSVQFRNGHCDSVSVKRCGACQSCCC